MLDKHPAAGDNYEGHEKYVGLILVTGASGFIGRALYTMMRQRGLPVRCALRRPDPTCDESVVVGDVGPQTDWAAALHGVKTVVHLAALVHNLGTLSADEAAAYHEVNAVGTLRLVQQAIAAGVQRFVFVSSAVVHGERTNGHPFDHASPPDPQTAYAQSKWDGERMIADLPGIEIVIVRPPLVYGERVRANFLRLIRLVDSGLPLPFAGIRNRRSLIGLTNLCDFLIACAQDSAAAGETFVISDPRAMSTPELVGRIAVALDRRLILVPVPELLVRAAARFLHREGEVEKLWGSLELDASKAMTHLRWQPPCTVEDEIDRTVRWYQRWLSETH